LSSSQVPVLIAHYFVKLFAKWRREKGPNPNTGSIARWYLDLP
jgi:hypothetical protein